MDSIKAAVGIGGAKIRIRIDNEENIRQGGHLCGQVILQGGKVEQKLTNLTLRIQLDKSYDSTAINAEKGHSAANEIIHALIVAESQMIRPGEEYAFDFQMDISENAPISTDTVCWQIKAIADIPAAMDSVSTVIFKVKPSAAQMAFDQAMLKLGYASQDLDNDLDTGSLYAEYEPIQTHNSIFSMLNCDFQNRDGDLHVEFTLIPEEDRLISLMESLMEEDENFPDLVLPCSSIFPDHDQNYPDLEYILGRIQEIFNRLK
jgi:sporulation-control protein spo0M